MVRAEASIPQLLLALAVGTSGAILGTYHHLRIRIALRLTVFSFIRLVNFFLFLHILGYHHNRDYWFLGRSYHRTRCHRSLLALQQPVNVFSTITYTTAAVAAATNTTTITTSIAANATRHTSRSCRTTDAATSLAVSFTGLTAAAAADAASGGVRNPTASCGLFLLLSGCLPTRCNVHIPCPQAVENVLLLPTLPVGRIGSISFPPVATVQRRYNRKSVRHIGRNRLYRIRRYRCCWCGS